MAVKSILVIRCGALGDLVYATSVIDALKLQFGNETTIDFVCTPGSGSLFSRDPRINRVFPLKHKKIPISFSPQKREIIKHSQKNPYDLLINFESGKQFKSLLCAIVANQKVGHFFTNMSIPKDVIHMVEIAKLSFKDVVSKDIYKLSFPKLIGTPDHELNLEKDLSDRYFIVSPSNSHQKRHILNYRAWQNSSWIELIEKLSRDIEVVVVGSKGEDKFFNLLKPYPKNVVDLVGKTSLPDLVTIIKNATGLIATDTGTAHIASATNTEVFALIGPTPAEQTGPYKSPTNKVHIISANLECSPCYKTELMKKCKDNLCMKNISVERVYNSIKSASLV